MDLRKPVLLFLIIAIAVSCNKEVVLTEETLPDEIFYRENSGKPFTGKCVIYYPNCKQVHYLYNFQNGVLNGSFKSFYKDGSVEYDGMYSDGELFGDLVKYDRNGLVCMKANLSKN